MGNRATVYGTLYYERLLSVPRERVLCVDVETTGLDPEKDEILQLAMVDGNGDHLLCTYVRPDHRRRWPKAREVNGITWAMVKDAPTIDDLADKIGEALSKAELIIGYNISFDQRMLEAAGVSFRAKLIYDVMEDYAQVWGRWSDRKGDYLWAKLSEAARRFGITLDAHDAANDAIATAHLFYAMLGSEDFREAAKAKTEVDARAKRWYEEQEKEKRSREHEMGDDDFVTSFTLLMVLILVIGVPAIFLATCVARLW